MECTKADGMGGWSEKGNYDMNAEPEFYAIISPHDGAYFDYAKGRWRKASDGEKDVMPPGLTKFKTTEGASAAANEFELRDYLIRRFVIQP